MNIADLYNKIYFSNREYIKSGDIDIDYVLADGNNDIRRGISLIIPIMHIREKYKNLVDNYSKIDPGQYYYNFDDLHITIFDLIHAKTSYKRNASLEQEFLEIAEQAINGITAFRIQLKGVVFSRGAGLIKGFDNGTLVFIRKNIRELLNIYHIKNDERYESESAHVTFVRFRRNLSDPIKFFETIEKTKDIELGEEEITYLELVEHDWYNSLQTKRVIARLQLKS